MKTPLSGKLGDHVHASSIRAATSSGLQSNNRILISEVPLQEIVSFLWWSITMVVFSYRLLYGFV